MPETAGGAPPRTKRGSRGKRGGVKQRGVQKKREARRPRTAPRAPKNDTNYLIGLKGTRTPATPGAPYVDDQTAGVLAAHDPSFVLDPFGSNQGAILHVREESATTTPSTRGHAGGVAQETVECTTTTDAEAADDRLGQFFFMLRRGANAEERKEALPGLLAENRRLRARVAQLEAQLAVAGAGDHARITAEDVAHGMTGLEEVPALSGPA
mmetsp:Transcript_21889/g.70720  ORF Transcript_21889/g.70720 Transcript_21889/m.70720 type:complete len:211 (+) Transcript_21889:1496-2128(+)